MRRETRPRRTLILAAHRSLRRHRGAAGEPDALPEAARGRSSNRSGRHLEGVRSGGYERRGSALSARSRMCRGVQGGFTSSCDCRSPLAAGRACDNGRAGSCGRRPGPGNGGVHRDREPRPEGAGGRRLGGRAHRTGSGEPGWECAQVQPARNNRSGPSSLPRRRPAGERHRPRRRYPPGELARQFRRFHGTPQAIASGLPGTALVLYLSRRIIEAHGGRLWAASGGAGHGATFQFTLARHASAAAQWQDEAERKERTR
jgi:hypothetical protein